MYYLILISLLLLCCIAVGYSFLIKTRQGLPILMYHKISTDVVDKLTISVFNFERQLLYLKTHHYNPISFEQLIQYHLHKKPLPTKPVLISFDDAYENNFLYLYPLLKKHGFKATIFLPVGFLGKTNGWDDGNESIMTFDRLKEMDSAFVEYGLHSFFHKDFALIPTDEVVEDTLNCFSTLFANSISFTPVLAYPFGRYPREKKAYTIFINTLKNNGVMMGTRIGNKINRLPLKDPFCIKRLDIHGTDSFWEFKLKIRIGRVKLF